jgi:hypothetical protein
VRPGCIRAVAYETTSEPDRGSGLARAAHAEFAPEPRSHGGSRIPPAHRYDVLAIVGYRWKEESRFQREAPLLTASVNAKKRAGQTTYPTRSRSKLQDQSSRRAGKKACAARICGFCVTLCVCERQRAQANFQQSGKNDLAGRLTPSAGLHAIRCDARGRGAARPPRPAPNGSRRCGAQTAASRRYTAAARRAPMPECRATGTGS